MIGFFEGAMADDVKIRYAWTPEPRTGALYLIVLAVGILLSWSVCFVLGLMVTSAIFSRLQIEPMAWVAGIAIAIGGFGAAVFVWGLSRIRYRRAIRRRPFRRARLDRLATQDDVWRRLPHRMVEKALFMRSASRRRMKRLLRKLAPGDTVLLNWPRATGFLRSAINEVPFEPIDVGDDHDRLGWLFLVNIQEQGAAQIQELLEEGDDDDDASSRIWGFLKNAFWALWMLAGVGFWIHALVIRRSLASSVFIGFLLSMLLLGWLLPLLAERKWWLVPGGMICREFRFWRRGHRAELITPAQSPLVVDMRSGVGYLLHGQAIRSFACPQWTAWAVAAGWMSHARTPTMEEVRAFLLTSE